MMEPTEQSAAYADCACPAPARVASDISCPVPAFKTEHISGSVPAPVRGPACVINALRTIRAARISRPAPIYRHIFPAFLTLLLLTSLWLCPAACAADYVYMEPFDLLVYSGRTDGVAARAYTAGYENNVYVSLTDLSAAMNGTSKQFSFQYLKNESEGEHFRIQTGEAYLRNTGVAAADRSEPVWLECRRNRLLLDGADRKYYTFRDGANDLYMSLTDFQLMLDVTVSFSSRTSVTIEPDRAFSPDIDALNRAGYFSYLNGVVLGDATTGEILFSRDRNKITSIASTTKLMTYLLLAEAQEAGTLSFDGTVTVSAGAERLSESADGTVKLEEGEQVPFRELLDAMLVASSNEAALALAEYACGSEAAFVEKMNARAAELHLNSAEFYDCHGLPIYSYSTVQTKLQNRMSALDLFQLASYLINRFPSVTEITSRQYVTLPTLEYTTANSNPLVFNLPSVTGLKTGSTNRAGCCLVASMPVEVNGERHVVILVLLGSETGSERGQQAEILLRAAPAMLARN